MPTIEAERIFIVAKMTRRWLAGPLFLFAAVATSMGSAHAQAYSCPNGPGPGERLIAIPAPSHGVNLGPQCVYDGPPQPTRAERALQRAEEDMAAARERMRQHDEERARIARREAQVREFNSIAFGAVALSADRTGTTHSYNHPDQRSAEAAALQQCGRGCTLLSALRDECLAVAVAPNGQSYRGYAGMVVNAATRAVGDCDKANPGGQCRLLSMPFCAGADFQQTIPKLAQADSTEITRLETRARTLAKAQAR